MIGECLGQVERYQLVPNRDHLKAEFTVMCFAIDAAPIGESGYAVCKIDRHFPLGKASGTGGDKRSARQMHDRPYWTPTSRISNAKLVRNETFDNHPTILSGNPERSLCPLPDCHRRIRASMRCISKPGWLTAIAPVSWRPGAIRNKQRRVTIPKFRSAKDCAKGNRAKISDLM
jgi:hypothetical protein